MAWISPRPVGCLAALILLGLAPSAQSAVRYASPSGSAAGTCTDPIGACSLEYAVETAANSGDEVVVLPGTHTLGPESGDGVTIDSKRLDLHGQVGQPRPRIFRSAGPTALGGIAVINGMPGTAIRHLEIEAPFFGIAVQPAPGLSVLEDLVVVGTDCGCGPGGGAVWLRDGWVLRDSSVRMLQPGGAGVLAGEGSSHVLNVTAFGIDPQGAGLSVFASAACIGVGPATLTAKNVIARGGQDDLRITNGCVGAGPLTLAIGNSNFRADRVALSGTDVAVDSSLGGNQTTMPPLFESEPLANFHQISGSPTIDAGTLDPLLGATDFDGQPRIQGCVPDIGADEFPGDPCPSGGAPDMANPSADATPPGIGSLRLRPRSFRAGERGGSISAVVGARVSYRLSEAARVRFSVRRRAPGRRVRWVRLPGSFSHRGQAAANSFRFSGRLRGRRLSPGLYRLIGVPTDLAGNRGSASNAGFTIVRPG